MSIKLIVGLGNPGKEYKNTRHNAGFMVIDHVVETLKAQRKGIKHLSEIYELTAGKHKAILAKPLTFMNNSGLAIENILEQYKILPSEMLVIYDDLDLPLGNTRLRLKGGSGGHKGVESIIRSIKTEEFPRLKIGIGKPQDKGNVINYVLSPFNKQEEPLLKNVIKKATECVKMIVNVGIEGSMEFCNKRDN